MRAFDWVGGTRKKVEHLAGELENAVQKAEGAAVAHSQQIKQQLQADIADATSEIGQVVRAHAAEVTQEALGVDLADGPRDISAKIQAEISGRIDRAEDRLQQQIMAGYLEPRMLNMEKTLKGVVSVEVGHAEDRIMAKVEELMVEMSKPQHSTKKTTRRKRVRR